MMERMLRNMLNNIILPITTEEAQFVFKRCVEQVRRNLKLFTYKFPFAASENNFYQPIDNIYWTTGFWTGQLWLAYEQSHENIFKYAALIQVESFLHRIQNKIEVDHHDMGFLYSLSCVAAYKLTGDKNAKKAALMAADHLLTRFRDKGQFIQAWGNIEGTSNYRLIIDSLLNLPLLYWATEVTKDKKYADIANKHITTSLQYVVRDDYSTYHTFYFDPVTGAPSHGETCQGYKNNSAWARGQAWGIYGVALSYRYTRKKEYINIFRNITNFYLSKLPEDMVPFWDLEFTNGSKEPRDSSSAAIVACGLLEMAHYIPENEAVYYVTIARKMIQSLVDHYAVDDFSISNGLLLHGTYSKRSPYNTCNHCGVDECTIWGDYFFMEALMRLTKDWETYW
ncbi:MAG: glucoronyl hydrolase [Epulopiscium sp.]|nr:glucoronyl hydrolase [Candidatus Epulonipiscium sp.]